MLRQKLSRTKPLNIPCTMLWGGKAIILQHSQCTKALQGKVWATSYMIMVQSRQIVTQLKMNCISC